MYESFEKSNGLFRKEALLAKQNKYGSPVKPLGVSIRIAGIFFIVLVISIVIFLTVVDFSRKEMAVGSLISTTGTLKIVAGKSGVVTKVFVKDGEIVTAGQPIIEVSTVSITSAGTNVPSQMLSNTDTQLDIIERERKANRDLNIERLREARNNISSSEKQIFELHQSISIQKLRIASLQKTLNNLETLRKDQLISEIQYREHESRLLTEKQTLISLRREMHNHEASIAQSRIDISKIDAQSIISSVAADASALQIQDKRLTIEADKSLVLTAKVAGRITGIRAKIGEPIQAGTSVAVIVPEGALMQAEIWVSSAAIPYLYLNSPVNIMYDAFPYQKFGLAKGYVAEISRSPTTPDELPLDLRAQESRYRVIVRLEHQFMMTYGTKTHLTPGMSLKSDLILDKRSLLEWFLEPVLASKSRL